MRAKQPAASRKSSPGKIDWQGDPREVYDQSPENCVAYTIVQLLRSKPDRMRATAASYRFAGILGDMARQKGIDAGHPEEYGVRAKYALDVLVELGIIASWQMLYPSENEVKRHLTNEGPLIGTFRWDVDTNLEPINRGELFFYPKSTDPDAPGRHCTLWDAIDLDRGRIITTNTWGIRWGAFGRGWAPFDRIDDMFRSGRFYAVSGRAMPDKVERIIRGINADERSLFAGLKRLFGWG